MVRSHHEDAVAFGSGQHCGAAPSYAGTTVDACALKRKRRYRFQGGGIGCKHRATLSLPKGVQDADTSTDITPAITVTGRRHCQGDTGGTIAQLTRMLPAAVELINAVRALSAPTSNQERRPSIRFLGYLVQSDFGGVRHGNASALEID